MKILRRCWKTLPASRLSALQKSRKTGNETSPGITNQVTRPSPSGPGTVSVTQNVLSLKEDLNKMKEVENLTNIMKDKVSGDRLSDSRLKDFNW